MLEKVGYSVNRDERTLIKLMDDIDNQFKDIANNYRKQLTRCENKLNKKKYIIY